MNNMHIFWNYAIENEDVAGIVTGLDLPLEVMALDRENCHCS